LNFRSIMGSFNIEDDGTVSFRSTISLVGGKEPSSDVIEENIKLGLLSINMFHEEVWPKCHDSDSTDPMFC